MVIPTWSIPNSDLLVNGGKAQAKRSQTVAIDLIVPVQDKQQPDWEYFIGFGVNRERRVNPQTAIFIRIKLTYRTF